MTRSHRHSVELPHKDGPLTFERLLNLIDEPDRELPEEIKRELSAPRIYLHGVPTAKISTTI